MFEHSFGLLQYNKSVHDKLGIKPQNGLLDGSEIHIWGSLNK